jgi:hypothetical protein
LWAQATSSSPNCKVFNLGHHCHHPPSHVELAAGLVCPVSYHPDAAGRAAGRQAAPAKLVAAAAGHVIAPASLLHAMAAPGAPGSCTIFLNFWEFVRNLGIYEKIGNLEIL